MKFSVRNAGRKWPCGGFRCDQWPSVAVAAALLMGSAGPGTASLSDRAVPLPRPRPAEAPATPDKPAEAAPVPSACRLALTEDIAIAPSIPPITGPGECGGDDLVRLEAIMLPGNKGRVTLKPAATLRCPMASAIADWIRTDVAPLAEAQGAQLSALDNFDSYECRGQNRLAGARLSEHGRANALDVRAFKLSSGASIELTDRTVPREVRESVLHSACARFTTVLGPGSDGYHENHIHLDLAERHSGYRICQWDVWDPLPHTAPLMPAERPPQAPPRQVAEKTEGKPESATAQLPRSTEPSEVESIEPVQPKPKPHKRRTVQRPLFWFR
jgi:hypothetical protein